MTIMLFSLLGLGLLIGIPSLYSSLVGPYVLKAKKLEGEVTALEVRREAISDEVEQLRGTENLLNQERQSLINQEHGLKPMSDAPAGPAQTVLEVLLKQNRITQGDIEKATKYKQDSGSPHDLEDILVMMDVIDQETLISARRELKKA